VKETIVKKIQVLGRGCSKCETTAKLIAQVAAESGAAIELSKVQSLPEIAAMGVMSTPAVAIDGKVVHSGSVPTRDRIAAWLK
jgi:small redox-active disulfide protein 2